jgi:hypothetical protein
MSDEGTYLIWSNEHRGWWGKDRWGFAESIEEAHRFSRDEALDVCLAAMPAHHSGCPLNDIPVRLADMELLFQRFTGSKLVEDPGQASDP